MSAADMGALQKGSADMILLALLESQPRHGYELAKLCWGSRWYWTAGHSRWWECCPPGSVTMASR